MEEDILRIMDVLKKGCGTTKADIQKLKKRIDEMLKANISLMDKAKDYKSDAHFLCCFIKKNIKTDDYMINNLLKKYNRNETEVMKNKKFNLY